VVGIVPPDQGKPSTDDGRSGTAALTLREARLGSALGSILAGGTEKKPEPFPDATTLVKPLLNRESTERDFPLINSERTAGKWTRFLDPLEGVDPLDESDLMTESDP